MTVGQLAGLIAALALVVLVIFIAWFLVKVAGAIRDAITSVEQLTKDVDTLSGELNEILKNSNSLLEDINKKAVQVDPAVQAIANLGQSVSDVNQASRSLVENLASRREKRRNSFMKSAAQAAAMGVVSRVFKRKKNQ
ncbi:DUF948 domain-containing protein [Limosilactobacillus fermentum]|uniref:DUF948 domain-containing protein n=1 Tax=Limosilactobacillus fermentum TaxID=1613 RepID=UPI0022E4032A|nr:DUF948 domain-containing protein [Limosilactobacillus fermentum]